MPRHHVGLFNPYNLSFTTLRNRLQYLIWSSISSSMSWFKGPAFTASPWLTRCCAILEQSSSLYHDHVLVWLTRFQQVGSEVYTQFCYQHKWTAQDNYQRELMRLGLVSRLREVQTGIPLKYATASECPPLSQTPWRAQGAATDLLMPQRAL